MEPTVAPKLVEAPQAMLWALHCRASEALRSDGAIDDPEAVRIYRGISHDIDFTWSFGAPDSVHAYRSLAFDEALQGWLKEHPNGTVVELACGLETRFQRIDNGTVLWFGVDVPRAMVVREHFLAETDRCHHIRAHPLDLTWLERIPNDAPICITAQGLLMYMAERDVCRLLTGIKNHFSEVDLLFDTVPRWFSRHTASGFKLTPYCHLPPMPWGVSRSELRSLLRRWSIPIAFITYTPCTYRRGWLGSLTPELLSRTPLLKDAMPYMVHVRIQNHRDTQIQA